jgi:hypothetical protein
MENNKHMKLYSPGCMDNNRKMKLYSPGCMENNKQMKLYYPGCMKITNTWSCIPLVVWTITDK